MRQARDPDGLVQDCGFPCHATNSLYLHPTCCPTCIPPVRNPPVALPVPCLHPTCCPTCIPPTPVALPVPCLHPTCTPPVALPASHVALPAPQLCLCDIVAATSCPALPCLTQPCPTLPHPAMQGSCPTDAMSVVHAWHATLAACLPACRVQVEVLAELQKKKKDLESNGQPVPADLMRNLQNMQRWGAGGGGARKWQTGGS